MLTNYKQGGACRIPMRYLMASKPVEEGNRLIQRIAGQAYLPGFLS